MTTVRHALLLGIVGLPLVVSCAPDVPPVTGEFGETPNIEALSGAPDDAASEVVIEGDGPPVEDGSLLVVRLLTQPVLESGELADPIASSFEQGSESVLPHDEFLELFPEDDAPDEPRVGSRIVNVLPAGETDGGETAGNAMVSVLDVVDAYPSDAEVSGTPEEELARDNGIDLDEPRRPVPRDGTGPPNRTRTLPLIEGEGAEIPERGQVVVQFSGVTWNDGAVFDTSWETGQPPVSLPLGRDSLVAAWDGELPGHTVGSRLLLLVPAEDGYGDQGNPDVGVPPDEPLIYVIDVLGVH